VNTAAGGNDTQIASQHLSISSSIDVSLVSDLRQGNKQRRSSCSICLDYFLGKAAPTAISVERNVMFSS
jgi:hypothetical protein